MRLCSIASGSSGNCIYVGDDQTHLLVDTGISKKRIEEGLSKLEIKGDELEGILITHEHVDHIQGLGVFSRKYEIPIYATPGTIEGIRNCKSLGKLPEGLLHEIEIDHPFSLGTLQLPMMQMNRLVTELKMEKYLLHLQRISGYMMIIP